MNRDNRLYTCLSFKTTETHYSTMAWTLVLWDHRLKDVGENRTVWNFMKIFGIRSKISRLLCGVGRVHPFCDMHSMRRAVKTLAWPRLTLRSIRCSIYFNSTFAWLFIFTYKVQLQSGVDRVELFRLTLRFFDDVSMAS